MEKNIIVVRDETTALEIRNESLDDKIRTISILDFAGYKFILRKYDKKLGPLTDWSDDFDFSEEPGANLLEEIEYLFEMNILSIYADFDYLDMNAVFEDGSIFTLDSISIEDNPEMVLDHIYFFEDFSSCFKSVEIEPGLKTYLKELQGISEDDE